MSAKPSIGKNTWALFLLLLCGVVIGGFIGTLVKDISGLSWLGYGQSFGLDTPVVLNLGIIVLTFGLSVTINIASILGVVIAAIIYKVI